MQSLVTNYQQLTASCYLNTTMQDFFRGMGRSLGIVAGFLPIAMSFGAIATQTGLSTTATGFMSLWVFAGASQFAAIEAIRQDLPWLSIILTILIVNLRHIPMSFAAQPLYHRFGRVRHWVLCHGLLDETFALEVSESPQPFLYYLGMHLCCWAAWVAGTWVGCQFGLLLPERWLQFALPALFLYLLVDNIRQRWNHQTAIVLSAGIAIVLATQSFGSTGILIALIGTAMVAAIVQPARGKERGQKHGE